MDVQRLRKLQNTDNNIHSTYHSCCHCYSSYYYNFCCNSESNNIIWLLKRADAGPLMAWFISTSFRASRNSPDLTVAGIFYHFRGLNSNKWFAVDAKLVCILWFWKKKCLHINQHSHHWERIFTKFYKAYISFPIVLPLS